MQRVRQVLWCTNRNSQFGSTQHEVTVPVAELQRYLQYNESETALYSAIHLLFNYQSHYNS